MGDYLLFEEPIGSMLQVHGILSLPLQIGEKKAEKGYEKYSCKNRKDIASQSIDIER